MKQLTTYIRLATMLGVGLVLAACSKSSSGSSSGSGNVVGLVGCSTCTGWGGSTTLLVASAYGTGSYPMAMSIELKGDSNIYNQLLYGGQNPAKLYQGQTYLSQAAINAASNIVSGSCIMPAGTYQISAVNAGVYQAGNFQIPQFQMTNGSYTLIMAMQGTVVGDYAGNITGFGARLYLIQGPNMYNGQITSCNDSLGMVLSP